VAYLPDAGHWVHTDNPVGLLDIISPSFGATRVPSHANAAAQWQ
jgi:pimeloyl-ACP methyl ester carboxylesterase